MTPLIAEIRRSSVTNRSYFVSASVILLALSGCHGSKDIALNPESSSGVVFIGIKTMPDPESGYNLVVSGFDAVQGKALGYFSGTRAWLSKSPFDHPQVCNSNNVCYFTVKLPPADYVLYSLNMKNIEGSPYAITLSNGTYMFHIDPGKVTYVGDYYIKSDMTTGTAQGNNGGFEPVIGSRTDVDAAREALQNFKGITAEMAISNSKRVQFEP